MDRLACIDLAAFPLQLLLRREAGWRERPVAVVDEDKPQGRILWLNERARECAILPGMRYAAGLALSSELCAGVVADEEIEKGVALVAQRLRDFGPDVEPVKDEPGVFRVGAGGLHRLQPSLQIWATRIRAALAGEGFVCGVVVGFERFATQALARALREPRVWVLPDAKQERDWLQRVPLSRLSVSPTARDRLDALGVRTVGDLLKLPAVGLRERFGEEAHRLHRAARGQTHVPVQPEEALEPLCTEILLDDGERDVGRLMFLVKRLLDPLLACLAERRQALAAMELEFKLERAPARTERLRPADPTLDSKQLLDLVLLRLESLRLESGVIELALNAQGVGATQKQLELFAEQPRRDPSAQRRAFARLRAEFGERSVVVARPREGHLPEASFVWTPLTSELPTPRPRLGRRTLVRRIYTRPWPLPHRPRHEEDGWQLRGRDDASVEVMKGPYVISGGWWRSEICRDYFFLRTRKQEWLWVFRDKVRRRWFLHGRIE